MNVLDQRPRPGTRHLASTVLFVIALSVAVPASAELTPTWYGTGTWMSAPGEIVDMAFFGGDLHAIGDFPRLAVDGSRIARFDGSAWTPVTGLPDERWVRIVPFGDDLYVESNFDRVYAWDGVTPVQIHSNASLIGIWQDQLVLYADGDDEILLFDGTAGWTPIPLGFTGYVSRVFYGGGDLFVEVRTGDSYPCSAEYPLYTVYVRSESQWVQTDWSSDWPLSATADWQGQAYIAVGRAVSWWLDETRQVAHWDGASWVDDIASPEPPGVPTTGAVTGLFPRGNQLLVQIGASLVAYDGVEPTPFADLAGGTVAMVLPDGDDSWFGGDFRSIGGTVANGFALHSGDNWSAPSVSGSGIESQVTAVGHYAGELVVATTPWGPYGEAQILAMTTDPGTPLADHLESERCWSENVGQCQTYYTVNCGPENADARSLLEHDGELFALGGIVDIDGLQIAGVASWDGAGWSAVDHDLQSGDPWVPEQLFALREIQGVLWLAGYDDTPVVQQFDGTRFHDQPDLRLALDALGPGCDYYRRYVDDPFYGLVGYGGPTVFDLIEFDGDLVLATDAGLVAWDGVSLTPRDDGWLATAPTECCIPNWGDPYTCPRVLVLASADGVLYAGGWFGTASDAIRNVVRYENGQWLPLGEGLDGPVKALVARNGYLVAGGAFTHAGSLEVNGIALWDGAQWQAIDGGVVDAFGGVEDLGWQGKSAEVSDLWLSDCGELWVGGRFAEAGGVPTSNLAVWSAPSLLLGPDCQYTSAPDGPRNLRLVASPNPFNPATEISFDLPRDADVALAVFDLAGRLVRTLESGPKSAGTHTATWRGTDQNARRVASGVYVVRLDAGADSRSIRVVMVK